MAAPSSRTKVQAVASRLCGGTGRAWLLVQIGVALRERGEVKRDSFTVVMPGGQAPLATQEQFLDDSARCQAPAERPHLPARVLKISQARTVNSSVVLLAGQGTGEIPHRAVRARVDWRSSVADAAVRTADVPARVRQRQGARRTADPARIEQGGLKTALYI
jgi:hypothetical protein